MPKSPRDKKIRNANNGSGQTKYKPPKFERNGKMVSAPRSRKNPCRVGWE